MSVAELTRIHEKALTSNAKGFRVSDFATDYIYQGKCFSTSQRVTVPAATNLCVLFDVSLVTKELSVYSPTYASTTGPLEIDYYYGGDYSGGTAFKVINRAYYGGAPQAVLTYGATGSDKGTLLSQDMVAAGHKDAGATSEGLELIPPPANVLVELNNTNGVDATVLVRFVWFEV